MTTLLPLSLEPTIITVTTEHTPSHALAKAARKRLKNTCYFGIRALTCECDDRGVLYLRGRLASYYHKQLAQEALADLPGVVEIVNQAEVVSGPFAGPALA